jgi:hypothetical protein
VVNRAQDGESERSGPPSGRVREPVVMDCGGRRQASLGLLADGPAAPTGLDRDEDARSALCSASPNGAPSLTMGALFATED